MVVFGSLMLALAVQATAVPQAEAAWRDIKTALFGTEQIAVADGQVKLTIPNRAEDAALVPVTIAIGETPSPVTKLTLIVDENPVPVAAVIGFGPEAGKDAKTLSTRIRLDRYTMVRAIAQAENGALFMDSHFVKASGGCSAAASKDPQSALEDLGKIKASDVVGADGTTAVQIGIRHPNFTGMQMDYDSRAYVPARYVSTIVLQQGVGLVAAIESGISISENPAYRLSFARRKDKPLNIAVRDSSGAEFSNTLLPAP